MFNSAIYAETPQSIVEIDQIQTEALAQIDDELNVAKDDLNMRKSKEIKVVEDSAIKESEKPVMIKKIENKYLDLEQKLDKKYSTKKRSVISYYTQMKQDMMDAMPPSSKDANSSKKNKEPVFIPPQKLMGKW
ncbi:MAG: hypothetical protein AB7V50_04270, partial [Vampirovibrionia bacterium]